MEYFVSEYDVAVIGAGHAGIEAALAAARLGARTILFTIALDAVANLPCNPSIGGTAKGHLVCELDALGGEMGRAADAVTLQSRMLNMGKGPAVHSLRAQIDRTDYHQYMKRCVEGQENLVLKQAEIVDIRLDGEGKVHELITHIGGVYTVKTCIIATGTFLNAMVHIGDICYPSGPDGLHAACRLAEVLRGKMPLRRFKTGTPARVHSRSIDYSVLEEQAGDEPIVPFSADTKTKLENKIVCHITYTNPTTHEIIHKNIQRSAMHSGNIEGVGPRYCPSIEDKVVRFAERERHQIFVEPMGLDTCEVYLQGISTSLPEDVQIAMYRSIKGMEEVEILRDAYAIEYDCVDPTSLYATLESKTIPNLYGAGQFNGTSGYEEAAAQGLVAGINAARRVQGKEDFILERASSYIGTLIDDLVTKGCSDPYRMMTSRSEYRLMLRQDNADARLTPLGREVGLISDERWEQYCKKQDAIAEELGRLKRVSLPPSEELNALFVSRETAEITQATRFLDLLRRPQLTYGMLIAFDENAEVLPPDVQEQVQILVKYEGYIQKQQVQIAQMKRLEDKRLPENLDYASIHGLRLEAKEKLLAVRPRNLGQASRISGVSPADVSVLIIWIEQKNKQKGETI